MKYIKKITPKELNEAFKEYLGVADKEDLWEVNGTYARPEDLCYASVDDNCYYLLQQKGGNNFIYFAFDKNRLINIKGLWETLYEMVKEGYPFIRFAGRHGRYRKIMKGFGYYSETHDTNDTTYEAFMVYVAHPENVEKIKRRFN